MVLLGVLVLVEPLPGLEPVHAEEVRGDGRGTPPEYVGPLTLPDTRLSTVDSDVIDARARITVAIPTCVIDGPIATLYLLDPIATLETTIGVTRALTMLAVGSFPALLVVGVGCDVDPVSTMSLGCGDFIG